MERVKGIEPSCLLPLPLLRRSFAGSILKDRPSGLRGVKAEGGQREEERGHGQSVPGIPGREVGGERRGHQGLEGQNGDDASQKAQAQVHPEDYRVLNADNKPAQDRMSPRKKGGHQQEKRNKSDSRQEAPA